MQKLDSMSSTSSSECLCNECFNYATFREPGFMNRAPYYQNLAHPLIYYARVQRSPNFQQRNKEAKKGPNCFVKAFRWYTQEHLPPQSRELPPDRTDLAGFAMWLDKKYDEFIVEKRGEQDRFNIHANPISELEPNETQVHLVVDPKPKEIINRIKSPKKRRRPMQFGATTSERHDQSFEYILMPKDLSRPASECCRQILSNDMEASKRTLLQKRGHSSERTLSEKTESMPIEMIKIDKNKCMEEVSKIRRPEIKELDNIKHEVRKVSSIKPAKSVSYVIDVKRVKSTKDVVCQCSEEKLAKGDASTQYDVEDKPRTVQELLNHSYCCPVCANRNDLEIVPVPSQKPAEQKLPELKTKEIITMNDTKNESKSDSNLCLCSDDLILFVESNNNKNQFMQEQTHNNCCCCTNDDDFAFSSQTLTDKVPTNNNVKPAIEGKGVLTKKTSQILYHTSANQTSDHAISFVDSAGYPFFMKIVCADKLREEFTCKRFLCKS